MAVVSIHVKTSFVLDPDDPEGKRQVEVMRITDFCRCVNKNNQQIHTLIYEGNKIRKLKVIIIAGAKFIPVSEVTEYPFTLSGRSDSYYHYDEDLNERVENGKEKDS